MPSDLQITNIRDQANANSAITIASDGQITVNQDNPTITLGTNTTFPTGHVIQTKTHTFEPTAHQDLTTTPDDALASNLQVTITPNHTSNTLIVTCFLGNVYNFGTTNHSLDAGFKYHADWTGTPVTLGLREFVTNQHLRLGSNTVLMANFYFQTIATAPVTTPIIIRPWFKTNTGDVRIFDNSSSTVNQATLTVMEIQA